MSLYLDRYYGLWQLLDDPDETHRWLLISSNNKHDAMGVVRRSGQNDTTMQEEFAPLRAVATGEVFKFKPRWHSGDYAWVDLEDILYSGEFTTYDGSRDEVLVTVASVSDKPGKVIVEALVETDASNLKPYITNEDRT